MSSPLAQILENARASRDAGALSEAERLYRQALALSPAHAQALTELAEILDQRGAGAEAQSAGEAAIAAAYSMAFALIGTPLESRAPSMLHKAVQAHASLPAGPLAQAELLRRLGDLEGARLAAGRCLQLDPENARAQWLQASLSGRRLAPNPRFVSPSAQFVIDDFLPRDLHRKALAFALGHDAALAPSTTGGPIKLDNWRRSQVDREPAIGAEILPAITAAGEEAVRRFGLEPFEMVSREIQFTAHNEGDFYKVHRDWTPEDTDHRRLTFVYYLHRQPRGFDGGGLRLFDTSEDGGQFFEHAYTKVQPTDNRLVFFPSYIWHEVEGVRCASGRYEDGRFTLNGWLGVTDTRNER